MVTPEQTIERVRPWLAAIGITRIANVTRLDRIGLPVVMVCRPNSKSLAVFQGKGSTLAAAKASGLMESVEAYHAEYASAPLELATYDEVSRHHLPIDVDELPQVKSSQFKPDLPIFWVEGFDLLQREAVWIPYESVHLDFTEPGPPSNGCFVTSSNGLASGNHILEAISHGICEIVERDALTLWTQADAEAQYATRVDLTTVADPECRSAIEKFARANVDAGVWEITSDIGIPAYLCNVVEQSEDPIRRLYSASGMGCHPSRNIALLRALTEAAQSRLAAISGSRDDFARSLYQQERDPAVLDRHRTSLKNHAAMRTFDEAPSWEAETFNDDVAWQLDRLRSVGIQRVAFVDLTKPEFGIPVVRVVIPGLECAAMGAMYALGKRGQDVAERYRR